MRLVGLGWLAASGVLLALGSLVTAGLAELPVLVAPLVLALSLAVNTVLWLWTSWILPNRPRPRGGGSCPARSPVRSGSRS